LGRSGAGNQNGYSRSKERGIRLAIWKKPDNIDLDLCDSAPKLTSADPARCHQNGDFLKMDGYIIINGASILPKSVILGCFLVHCYARSSDGVPALASDRNCANA
jgi:hypothetical protein